MMCVPRAHEACCIAVHLMTSHHGLPHDFTPCCAGWCSQIIIPGPELLPEKLACRKGEERLKERVQKVLAGIHKKLDSDPRMSS